VRPLCLLILSVWVIAGASADLLAETRIFVPPTANLTAISLAGFEDAAYAERKLHGSALACFNRSAGESLLVQIPSAGIPEAGTSAKIVASSALRQTIRLTRAALKRSPGLPRLKKKLRWLRFLRQEALTCERTELDPTPTESPTPSTTPTPTSTPTVSPTPTPTLLPPPGTIVDATHIVRIKESANTTTANYPIQLGHVFRQGEILHCPLAFLNGAPVFTQANVKNRWGDGTVKFAVLSFIIPTLTSGQSVTVNFGDQLDCNTTNSLSAAQMLEPRFNFDVETELTGSSVEHASARTMLQAGHFQTWLSGPVATSIILADHSTARAYDMGPNSRQFRPIFHATFWASLNRVTVAAIGELGNTVALGDYQASVTVRVGEVNPITLHTESNVPMYLGSRWIRRGAIGGTLPSISIDHGTNYLAATGLIPNYSSGVVLTEAQRVANYQSWQGAPQSLYSPVLFSLRMANTGGRPEIGPFHRVVTDYLHSQGDPRMATVMYNVADHFASFPHAFREGAVGRFFDHAHTADALGRPVSPVARRTLVFWDSNSALNSSTFGTTPEDAVTITGPRGANPWEPDCSHQSELNYLPYLLTGDYFYLEELLFWASWGSLHDSYYYSRGLNGAGGGLGDQTRGQAWNFRTRARAATAAPDGTVEKSHFTELVNQAIAGWEGRQGIVSTSFHGTPMWNFGAAGQMNSPLHYWDSGTAPQVAGHVQSYVTAIALPWQNYFVMVSLNDARRMGFATGPLLQEFSQFLTQQVTSPSYDRWLVAQYYMPEIHNVSGGGYFQTLADVKAGYTAAQRDAAQAGFIGDAANEEHGYSVIARAAAAGLVSYPGGSETWNFIAGTVGQYMQPETDPKWYIMPE